MTQNTDDPSHERQRVAQPFERLEDPSADEFEVTITHDEGDPDRFHITSISPRPRQ